MKTLTDLGISPGHTQVVVEAGQCNNDLAYALDAVDAAAEAGAWGFKVQMLRAEWLTTRTAPTYGQGPTEPRTQYEAFDGALRYTDWKTVQDRCDEKGLVFFASVFDPVAVEFAADMGFPLIKIASADITHKVLIQAAARTGIPMVLSTGASTIDEIQRAYRWVHAVNPDLEFLPMICTLCYPTPPQEAHLARITTYREQVNDWVGYSDHTQGIDAMLIAEDAGAVLIEKHFTLTPGAGGDHDFAITPGQLARFTSGVIRGDWSTDYETWWGDPTIAVRRVEMYARKYARRSIAAKVDIPNGTVITRDMVTFLRPGTGIEPWMVDEKTGPIGKLASKNIAAGELLPQKNVGAVVAHLTVE